ncbi:hypothetical protein [Propionivibrio sp.]|uniref:hypothetical protein n=1 Tax=Propionivibrio sp. TaxID=2212460 RepID=UPI0039E38173
MGWGELTLQWLQGAKELAFIVSAIAIPVIVAKIGGDVNSAMKESENRIRYVELAITQLRSSPSPETAALRDWAVELLDTQSPVKLSTEAKAQLKSKALAPPVSAVAPGGVGVSVGSGSGGDACAK